MVHAREDYNRIQDPAGKIPDDEPVFLIRAQDSVGAMTVLEWAKFAEKEGAANELVQKARDHAIKMANWPVKKVADL